MGIGTSSISSKLYVAGGTNDQLLRVGNTNAVGTQYISIYANGAEAYYNSVNTQNSVYGSHIWQSTNNGGTVERARINSSGALLVGTTSTYNSERLIVDSNGGSTSYNSKFIYSGTTNTAYCATTWSHGQSGTATGYVGVGGSATGNTAFANNFVVGTQTASALVFNTGDAERARITSGGQLLVGTTTTSGGEIARFQTASGATYVGIIASTTGSSYVNFGDTSDANVGFIGYDHTSNYMHFRTNSAEAMRIDSSQNLLVGTTSQLGVGKVNIAYAGASAWGMAFKTTGQDNSTAIVFRNSSDTSVGSIQTTTSATSYVTSSDYRLKNTIAPMIGALAKVALLKPVTYKWNADGSDGEGFIAHELAEVCPQAVAGEKDAVNEDGSIKPQGIDTSFLVATLTAAIQEQQAIIESLKARLDAANL
jgi:hypothetical protein